MEFDKIKNYLPLQESNQKYRFFHKSIHEYFAAMSIMNEVQQLLSLNLGDENSMKKLF